MIAQDNGEMAPIIDTHLFEAIVTIGIFVIILAAFFIEMYRVGIAILEMAGEYLWNLLAHEVKWLNIAFISVSIFTGGMMFLIMSEISKKLDTAFTQLKTEIKKKDEYIAELEAETGIKEKDEYIAELEADLKIWNYQFCKLQMQMDEKRPKEQEAPKEEEKEAPKEEEKEAPKEEEKEAPKEEEEEEEEEEEDNVEN